jgi:hypothetical protein
VARPVDLAQIESDLAQDLVAVDAIGFDRLEDRGDDAAEAGRGL